MDAMKSDFYITLPSNASADYFPENKQGSYRTKLSSALNLGEFWEVGLSEIIIPRNWFNIGPHNNEYFLTYNAETTQVVDHKHYELIIAYEPGVKIEDFFFAINTKIREIAHEQIVNFIPDSDEKQVSIELENDIELILEEKKASKLLYMLHLPDRDIALSESTTRKYRASNQREEITITINDRRPLKENSFIMPLTYIKPKANKKNITNFSDIMPAISENLRELQLENYINFVYDPLIDQIIIKLSDYASLEITKHKAPTFLHILQQNVDRLVIKEEQTFKINPLLVPEAGEHITLIIKEYPTKSITEKVRRHMHVNAGVYKTAKELFAQFKEIYMQQLPDYKVFMEVPPEYEIEFGKGLQDFLGFWNHQFKPGRYISEYPLELDAGISEIFVYSDIISGSYVGDTYAPLLRVIQRSNEKGEQIVKHYEKPIYFPSRKHFWHI